MQNRYMRHHKNAEPAASDEEAECRRGHEHLANPPAR
jgi:hypothetical protein